jgi:hypothetical protein
MEKAMSEAGQLSREQISECKAENLQKDKKHKK